MSKLAKKARTIELESVKCLPYWPKHKDEIKKSRRVSKEDLLRKTWRRARHDKKMYRKFETNSKLTKIEQMEFDRLVDASYDRYSA